MSAQTGIEWADSTFNPWMGCTKVSPACDRCYAERDTKRFGRVEWGAGKPRVRTTSVWNYPARWNDKAFYQCRTCGLRGEFGVIFDSSKAFGIDPRCLGCGDPDNVRGARRRVFCASLADWLDNEVPIEWLVDLLDLIRRTPNLDWLLLSKRIGNWRKRLCEAAMNCKARALESGEAVDHLWMWISQWANGSNPPSNVWLGATVINQAEADRDVPKLLAVPARVRFLSIEPMLGLIDLSHRAAKALPIYWEGTPADGPMPHYCGHSGTYLGESARRGWAKYSGRGIDWIIAGGESGPHARPMHPDWVRSLRDQCAAAGVAFLFKQWGEWGEFVNEDHYTHAGEEKHAHAWVDRATGEHGKVWLVDDDGMWSNWTGDPRSADIGGLHDDIAVVGKHGKKAAGRKLDGRTHDGFPAVQP